MIIHLPSGLSDFKQLRENRDLLYVDKTYFIKEWWESSYDKVTLITRPRFFGKTLILSMVDYFFSVQYDSLQYLFNDLFISYETAIMIHQGQIPVIFLSFGDIKSNNPNSIKQQIKMKIWQAYIIYKKVMLESPFLDSSEKQFICSISHDMDDDVAIHSIQALCGFLFKVYEEKNTIILLDEYDSIMVNNISFTESNKAYDGLREFYIAFITSTFKDNKYLLRGLITGLLNVSLFSDFNGPNHIKIYTVMSNKYLNCFGYTSDEVLKLTELFQLTDKLDVIEQWYGGYNFGYKVNEHIYSPWSISQFFNQPYSFATYWFNTSSNEFIREVLIKGPLRVKDNFIKLLQGKSVKVKLSSDIALNAHFSIENHKSVETFYTILLSIGYLSIKKEDDDDEEGKSEKDDTHKQFVYLNSYLIYPLKMPNLEIVNAFDELLNDMFDPLNSFISEFIESFMTENVLKMESSLLNFFTESFEYFDNTLSRPEVVYRSFLLILTVHIKNIFYVKLFDKFLDDQNFYVLLKPLNNDNNNDNENADDDDDNDNNDDSSFQSSFVFVFKRQSTQKVDKNLSNLSRSIIDHLDQTWFSHELKKRGIEMRRLKKFGFAYNDKELKIHFNDVSQKVHHPPSPPPPPNQHQQHYHQEVDDENDHNSLKKFYNKQHPNKNSTTTSKSSTNNNNNNNNDDDNDEEEMSSELILLEDEENRIFSNEMRRFYLSPRFDHRNKTKIRENDEVFVIDNNGVDIWDAVVLHREQKKNIYHIHYPDFPEDDEKIKGVARLLVKTPKNIEIFRMQEEVRRKKEKEIENLEEGQIKDDDKGQIENEEENGKKKNDGGENNDVEMNDNVTRDNFTVVSDEYVSVMMMDSSSDEDDKK